METNLKEPDEQSEIPTENINEQSTSLSIRRSKRLSFQSTPNRQLPISRSSPNILAKSEQSVSKKDWEVGMTIEARDTAKNWYKSRIIEIDSEKNRIKIHFFGWNSRYDQWFDSNSEDLRVIKGPKTPKSEKEIVSSDAVEINQKYETGKTIMAKWIDESYYPAKINRFLLKNKVAYYEVKFYDGFKKIVRFNNIREPSEEELTSYSIPEHPKVEKSPEENERRAEAELLLAIQEPVLKEVKEPTQTEPEPVLPKPEEVKQQAEVVIRKSERVKRPKKFTDEIIFDSPGSIASNVLVQSPKRKKSDSEQSKPINLKQENLLQVEEDEEEKKLKKKLKKDKKKIFEQLIESSKQQLEQQQRLIAQQLEEHQAKKNKKKLEKLLKKQKRREEKERLRNNIENLNNTDGSSSSLIQLNPNPNEPICCTIQNCTKTFRKQSLLEYHLKYHHYVDFNSPTSIISPSVSGTQMVTKAPKRRTSSTQKNKKNNLDMNELIHDFKDEDDFTFGHSLKSDDEQDPYEVIHCKCASNTNKGFMIQCEICLCWQHGNCENIKSNSEVPDNYLCWVCNEPNNQLKKLKYQNWMNTRLEKEIKLARISKDESHNKEILKLRMLNDCSKRYYGLNLLMYTLEYQMSLFTQMTSMKMKEEDGQEQAEDDNITEDENNNNYSLDYDDEAYDQLDKLAQNISHLQSCLTKKFTEFNEKLDEYESKYPVDDKLNSELNEFNLDQLYNQIKSFL